MAMAPAIIVCLFAQRWVMSSLTQGAIKQPPPRDPRTRPGGDPAASAPTDSEGASSCPSTTPSRSP